jgi:hypothetical protein
MVKLHFNSTEEFESVFKSGKRQTTDAIVQGIEKAVLGNKRTAALFEITFQDVDLMYEISLPKSQWVQALESCVEHYHKLELVDEQIDTWKLLEAVKVC